MQNKPQVLPAQKQQQEVKKIKAVEPKSRLTPAEFLSYEPDLKYPAVVRL